MRRRLTAWLVLIPLCLLMVVFALANRHAVGVNFNPLVPVDASAPGSGIPLFLVIYAALFLGIALGGASVWFAQASHRKAERRHRKEAEALRGELERTRGHTARDPDPAMAAVRDLG
ncbi:lipopolysaccharide assembly protein LapA domain-containing protein [Pelagibacterium montanilacus]|uniref:lipopolysaccharide assembly protein LapA domain-containing protein n=1 Tax=Pelagibacterium montanilacus TaxID=2185280 RepID=UPI0013DFEAE6|nr:LapA family protein [Pelagibacterium montanilacus]